MSVMSEEARIFFEHPVYDTYKTSTSLKCNNRQKVHKYRNILLSQKETQLHFVRKGRL